MSFGLWAMSHEVFAHSSWLMAHSPSPSILLTPPPWPRQPKQRKRGAARRRRSTSRRGKEPQPSLQALGRGQTLNTARPARRTLHGSPCTVYSRDLDVCLRPVSSQLYTESGRHSCVEWRFFVVPVSEPQPALIPLPMQRPSRHHTMRVWLSKQNIPPASS